MQGTTEQVYNRTDRNIGDLKHWSSHDNHKWGRTYGSANGARRLSGNFCNSNTAKNIYGLKIKYVNLK